MSRPDGPPLLARSVFGRAAELDTLRRLLTDEEALATIALVGEAGIGKTRLARWAVAAARERGWAVVEGRTHLGLPEPLGVIRDAVRGASRDGLAPAGEDPIALGLPTMLLPELGAGAIDVGGDAGALYEATIRYFGALAGAGCLLVVLEDLHWADASSLTLTALLARTLPRGVALLVTFRPDDDAVAVALERLRAELSRIRVRELPLGPLAPDESADMLEELLGRRPPGEVTAELIRLSGGNPFALEELARAVVESGWIDAATGARQSDASVTVPWTLAESIRARCSRLAPAEGDVIRWAAVIGEQFDVRLVAAAADIGEDEALSALAQCVAAGLVVEDASDSTGNRFAFRHALVHEALIQERLVAERTRRHSAVLAAAERLVAAGMDFSPAEMARHAVAAGDRRRIVVWGRAAAGRAYEVGAIEEAVAHLELALARWDLEDGEQLRAELLLECGRLRARLSRGDERAVELLERAREAALALGEAATAAVALALLADARFEFGQREQALADWDEALTELREVGPSEAIPQALAGHARGLGLQSDFDASRRVADEGLALLPEAANADQARVRVSLLTTRGMIDMLEYRLDEGRPRLLEAARLAVEHSDDLGAARAHHILGSNMFAVPPHESVSHFTRAAELVRRHGLRGLEAWYVTLQAWSMVHAGDWSTAERLLDEAESLIDDGERAAWTRLIAESVRADRLIGLGELDAAANALAHVAERGTEMGSANFRDTWVAARAGVACLAGDIEAAHADVHRFADGLLTGSPGAFAVLELNNWLLVVEILAAAGDLTRAAAVAAVIREQVGGVMWADYTDAVADSANVPPDDAAARIATAIAAVEATGYLLEAARMRVAASVVLATRPSGRAAAAGLARAAHERFTELGSPAWCRRLEEMLRRLGEPLTRRGGGAGGLTRRELEVLGALAEGLTNRGIAERLVISESTAIRHVANIYGKLGANNRAAAVRIATERGLMSGRADMATGPDGGAEDT